jgi:hypothetical protein
MTAPEHAPPDFLAWVATRVHGHRAELLRYARRRGLAAEEALDRNHASNRRRKRARHAEGLARLGRAREHVRHCSYEIAPASPSAREV